MYVSQKNDQNDPDLNWSGTTCTAESSSRQAEYHTMQNSECDFFSHTSSLIIAFALEI